MKSRMESPLPGRLTRRTAMVTISAPDSSCAWRMISLLAYLPVPTISREVKSLPPSTRFVSCISITSCQISWLGSRRRSPRTAATHGPNDFDAVAVAQRHRGVRGLRRDLAVDGHRRVLALHRQMGEQRFDAEPIGNLHLAPVHRDLHGNENGRSPIEGAAASVRVMFPSPALPGSGSRGPGPHPVLRNPPPTTPGRVYTRAV